MSIYYEPKIGAISDCVDIFEFDHFINDINNDTKLSAEQRRLLKLLATRFLTFRFDKVADYYNVTDKHMQSWLEKLRAVIVDTESAIDHGYLIYKDEYSKLIERVLHEK